MNALSVLNDTQRLALAALFAAGALIQLHTLLLALERRSRSAAEVFTEAAVLVLQTLCFAAVAAVHTHITVPDATFADLSPWLYASCAALAVGALLRRRILDLCLLAVAAAALPCLAARPWYAASLTACGAFCAMRALLLCQKRLKERASGLTRASFAEALDALSDGVLFAAADGRPVLANSCVHSLCRALTGSPLRDGNAFWDAAASIGEAQSDGSLIVRLSERVWSLSRRLLSVDGRAFSEIFAADVTELDRTSRELERVNVRLRERADALRETGANLAEIKREQELARLQSRIHDVAGHRVYLLQHYIERGGAEHLDELLPLISGLIDDLRADVTIPAARLLSDLQKSFAVVGIELDMRGELPGDERAASALIKIVREAATNAARHANATKIDVSLERDGHETVMRVRDNGTAAAAELREGQGLKGMRERAAELGGTIEVELSPRFLLTVRLPSIEMP